MKSRSRRWFTAASLFSVLPARAETLRDVTVREAHETARAAKTILVDIRTPEEWRETGTAAGAHLLDMTDANFLGKLAALTGGDKSADVTLICRTGRRTKLLQAELAKLGYGRVTNVLGGMIGAANGKGWIDEGLPVESAP